MSEKRLPPHITEDDVRMIAEFITPAIAGEIVGKLKATQEVQIEAAAKALFALEEPDSNAWRWTRPNPNTPDDPFAWHGYWLNAARMAIEAAYLVALKPFDKELSS